MKHKVIIGGKTLDNIALSMYKEAKVIFREYIQNATDAIDAAVEVGILREGGGKVEIRIDAEERRITIEDNGRGLSSLDFISTLLDIGNSNKKLEKARGYRGIGRFCGLAYCKTLIFTSTLKGETYKSVMIFDAEKLRAMIDDDEKYTAEMILNEVSTFNKTDAADAEHFFRVELLDVTNADLLNVDGVRDYLSFVAPVPYSKSFAFRKKIKEHAAELDFAITEYDIEVNGKQVVKNYSKSFTTRNGADEIFDVVFRDFHDEAGDLIAWSWIGLSTFKGVIQQTKANPNKMRGIRLRQKNIQIGDETALQRLFSEDRGTTYFIGEVYAVDTNLKPNSQRDYFADNDACKLFDATLRGYFDELYKLYRYASEVRSAFKVTIQPKLFEQKIKAHTLQYQETHRAEHDKELNELLSKAAESQEFVDTERQTVKANPATAFSRVFEQIDETITVPLTLEPSTPPPPLLLQHWSDEARQLYDTIHEIILANPRLAGNALLDKIKAELAK